MRNKKADGSPDYDKIVKEMESFYSSFEDASKKDIEDNAYKSCSLTISLIAALAGILSLLWAVLVHYGIV